MNLEIKALEVQNKLAATPERAPQFFVEVKNGRGDLEKLGDPRATRAMIALMNQHAVMGGAAAHWGGPAAFAEMMSSLHAIMFREKNWYKQFNFVNDAGHAENGIYALRANYGFDDMKIEDLKGFRSVESKLTGHGEAHLNPQGVFISNGPLGSGLPQAQGLALADRLLGNERTTVCVLSDGAAMEGEAKESFAAIPGLSKKGKLAPFVLIISDNNTKLSGRIDEDSFEMTPTFNSLETLGWDKRTLEDGHDIEAVHHAIDQAISDAKNNPHRSIVLILKTIKGHGVKFTEQSASGGHGHPLRPYDSKLSEFIDEIYNGDTPELFKNWASDLASSTPQETSSSESAVKKEKVQLGFARAAIEMAKKGLPVYSVSSDLQGSTGIAAFQKEFPSRYIDLGIAESNMVSTAIGLSKQGLIPIVDTFAQFAISKGNLPLIMAGLSQGPVIALFSHIGLQDAADGASHQATTYLSSVSSIPHVDAVVCSCSSEAEAYMTEAIEIFAKKRSQGKTPHSTLFFLGRENFPTHYNENLTYEWKKAQVLVKGSEGVIVTCGPMVPKALESATKESLTVINMPFVNSPDVETVKNELQQAKGRLITIEDHQIRGGMGAMLIHDLALHDITFKARSLGYRGEFGQSAYKADHLYEKHGLTSEGILKALKEL